MVLPLVSRAKFVKFMSLQFKKAILQIQVIVKIAHMSVNIPHLPFQRYILILLLFGISSSAFNQVITGVVVDEETKETVPFATIYFSGTFVGTAADQDGGFKIDVSEYASMPLKVSAIGYYTATLTNYKYQEQSIVYLKPKVYEIGEAAVKTKSRTRERRRNLRLFRAEFIGASANSQNCVITNEEDITFNYGSDRDTLKVYARKPIQVENKSLGYKVIYFLDIFEYNRRSRALFFSGEIKFIKDVNIEEPNRSFVIRREKTYRGSRMHFFRSFWANELESNGFIITNTSNIKVKPESIIDRSEDGNKHLTYSEQLIIGYYQKRYSEVSFLKDEVYFEESGYFDPAGINWAGDMANKRIADWLPYDYSIEIKE